MCVIVVGNVGVVDVVLGGWVVCHMVGMRDIVLVRVESVAVVEVLLLPLCMKWLCVVGCVLHIGCWLVFLVGCCMCPGL